MIVSRSDFVREVIPDSDPDTSYLEQKEFGKRLRQYRAGQFAYVGIRAKVELSIPHGRDTFITQTIHSPGLWGIEDDFGDEYLDSVYADECDVLASMLTEMGMEVVA